MLIGDRGRLKKCHQDLNFVTNIQRLATFSPKLHDDNNIILAR